MGQPAKIAFDIDGVVIDIDPILCNYFWKKYRSVKSGNQYDFDVYTSGKISLEQYMLDIEIATNENGMDCRLLPEAKNYLEKFYDYIGEPLLFVTARGLGNKNITERYFLKNLFGIEYTLVFDRNKSAVLKRYNVDFFVEDKPSNVEDVKFHVKKVFVMNQPWNVNFSFGSNPHSPLRVNSLSEVYSYYTGYVDGFADAEYNNMINNEKNKDKLKIL